MKHLHVRLRLPRPTWVDVGSAAVGLIIGLILAYVITR